MYILIHYIKVFYGGVYGGHISSFRCCSNVLVALLCVLVACFIKMFLAVKTPLSHRAIYFKGFFAGCSRW